MARVFRNGWEALAVGGAAQREIETLETLRRDLPDSYTVYHGVHWTHLDKGFAICGEADFVVVGPRARDRAEIRSARLQARVRGIAVGDAADAARAGVTQNGCSQRRVS